MGSEMCIRDSNNSNNNNSNNNGGKGNGKTNTTDKQVKTGDTEVPIVWGMTMLLACAAVVAIIRRKVRK